jgi:serine/threonine protein kinase
VSVINRGAFGLVILCKETATGEPVAVKLIERGPKVRVFLVFAFAPQPTHVLVAAPARKPPHHSTPFLTSADDISLSLSPPPIHQVTEYVQREIINHLHLRHPHVISLRTVFLTPTHLGIAMEHAAGGDLFQLVTRARAAAAAAAAAAGGGSGAPPAGGGLPEPDARWYFQQLVCALEYCHAVGVASRDVKLENTLLDGEPDRPLLKLCDFGYSKHDTFQSAPDSRVGTPAYLAPEVILTNTHRPYDAKAADVWSAGVVLFILLTASYPFGRPQDDALPADQRLHAMLQRILAADWPRAALAGPQEAGGGAGGGGRSDEAGAAPSLIPPPHPGTASPACVDLLARMLTADPARRATLAEVAAHPWFVQDLPPGVADLNARLVAEQMAPSARAARQPAVEAAMAVLAEAATAPAARRDGGEDEDGDGDGDGAGGVFSMPAGGGVAPGGGHGWSDADVLLHEEAFSLPPAAEDA